MDVSSTIASQIKKWSLDKSKKRLFQNFFSLSALQASNYIFALITLPYLVRVLGPEKYGLIAFAQAFTGYFQILTEYGFNLSATRQVAIHRENKDKLNQIFSTVMLIKLGLLVLSSILLTILVFSISKFIQQWPIYYLTFGMVLAQTLFPVWLFQGMESMKYITLVNVLSRFIFTVLVFIVIRSEADYLMVPLLNFLGMLVGALISLYVVFNVFRIRFIFPHYHEIIFQLKEGWHIFISTVAISLYTVSNSFILGIFTNNTIVGYYSAAERIIKAIQALITPISQSIYPFISNLIQQSKETAIRFISKVLKVVGISSFLFSLFIFLFAPFIVKLVLGNQFYPSVVVLRILSFLPFIILISNILGIQTMLNFGYQKPFSRIIISASLINIVLLFILTPLFSLVGTASSVLVSELFVTISMYIFLRKQHIHLIHIEPFKVVSRDTR